MVPRGHHYTFHRPSFANRPQVLGPSLRCLLAHSTAGGAMARHSGALLSDLGEQRAICGSSSSHPFALNQQRCVARTSHLGRADRQGQLDRARAPRRVRPPPGALQPRLHPIQPMQLGEVGPLRGCCVAEVAFGHERRASIALGCVCMRGSLGFGGHPRAPQGHGGRRGRERGALRLHGQGGAPKVSAG